MTCFKTKFSPIEENLYRFNNWLAFDKFTSFDKLINFANDRNLRGIFHLSKDNTIPDSRLYILEHRFSIDSVEYFVLYYPLTGKIIEISDVCFTAKTITEFINLSFIEPQDLEDSHPLTPQRLSAHGKKSLVTWLGGQDNYNRYIEELDKFVYAYRGTYNFELVSRNPAIISRTWVNLEAAIEWTQFMTTFTEELNRDIKITITSA